MTSPGWYRQGSPVPLTGFVKVSPLPPDALDSANEVDFTFRINDEFPAFVLSDSTGMVIITDGSGLTTGFP